ncbi:hypothetical protein FJZ17_04265 [Candidatus Pacearchaeota archaeon]|nr:hypothetical protein [Candidatus Pacearchaeota archaeon]
MDWRECIKERVVKDVNLDSNLIKSTKEIAELKIKSAEILPENHYISRITLLYDALRGLLEAISLEKGYKIYNHECYTAFIGEILNLSKEASLFDELRKIRNGINYYGKTLDKTEAEQTIKSIKELIKRFK